MDSAAAAANPYCAVRPDLVVTAAQLFDVRTSNLEAGEKKLLVTAQAIMQGKVSDRWGHHAQGIIRKFCDHTERPDQPPLPWEELLEDAAIYDGVEGVSARTGNRPLSTVDRHELDRARLQDCMTRANLDAQALGRQCGLPDIFAAAIVDGTWPSVTSATLESLESALGADLKAAPGSERSLQPRLLMAGGLAAVVLAALAFVWTPGVADNTDDAWETFGYWDYDAVDGSFIPGGIVVREQPGGGLGRAWANHLEMAAHAELAPRQRNLWPVEVNREARRVCINYPDYPTYTAHIDFPGTSDDGFYDFGPCADRPGPGQQNTQR